MNITCYKCGQVGHIGTNCPHLTKVRTVAIRADGTEDPEMDPQEEEETDDNAVSYRTNSIRIVLDTEKQVTAKIMAMQTNATVLSKTVEPMHSHRSRHRE